MSQKLNEIKKVLFLVMMFAIPLLLTGVSVWSRTSSLHSTHSTKSEFQTLSNHSMIGRAPAGYYSFPN
jgi:hypothetical protein